MYSTNVARYISDGSQYEGGYYNSNAHTPKENERRRFRAVSIVYRKSSSEWTHNLLKVFEKSVRKKCSHAV